MALLFRYCCCTVDVIGFVTLVFLIGTDFAFVVGTVRLDGGGAVVCDDCG